MNYQKQILKRSIEARRIYVWGEVEEETAGYFVDKMDLLLSRNKDPIWVIIHSPGGSIPAAMAMIDEIEAAKKQGVSVKTCAMGMAHSAGAVILSMGSEGHRYVRPSSTVMMHPISFGLGSDYTDMQERAASFFKKESDLLNRKLADACGRGGKKFKSFIKEIDKGLWLSAEKAVEYGVADDIWKGSLPIDEKAISEQRGIFDSSKQSGQSVHHS